MFYPLDKLNPSHSPSHKINRKLYASFIDFVLFEHNNQIFFCSHFLFHFTSTTFPSQNLKQPQQDVNTCHAHQYTEHTTNEL
jgi:hypothetical protein